MKKHYLTFIIFSYVILILYLHISGIINNIISPKFRIYSLIVAFILIIIGIIFARYGNYIFKKIDLFLLLPLILIIFSKNGELSYRIANNRSSLDNKNITNVNIDSVFERIKTKEEESKNIDFHIIDENYMALSNHLLYVPEAKALKGKTIKIKGFVVITNNTPKGYFGIGKYGVTCCVADSAFVGFLVKKNDLNITNNEWYDIEGILEDGVDERGYNVLTINPQKVTKIKRTDEAIYVYPCYSYGDGSCSNLDKYGIEH